MYSVRSLEGGGIWEEEGGLQRPERASGENSNKHNSINIR